MTTWTTRTETADDIPAIRDILLAAFPTGAEADIVDALRADPGAWVEGLSMVATTSGGTPVGYALRVALTAIWIGIGLSIGLMIVAMTGVIPAVVGALVQELVDLATILYALRALSAPSTVLPAPPSPER